MSEHLPEVDRLSRLIAAAEQRKEFVLGEDGYVVYWPSVVDGAWNSWTLRALADELDRRNSKWDRQIRQEIGRPVKKGGPDYSKGFRK